MTAVVVVFSCRRHFSPGVIMQLWTSFVIAVGLAMDAFAVSLAIGACGLARDGRSQFRLIFHFGWFQTMMTVLGLLAGSTLARFLDGYGNWIALALLAFVGANMIRSGFSHEDHIRPNPSKGGSLVMLSVATSLDALVVGLSMAMLKTPILIPSIIIGIVAAGLSAVGLFTGAKLGELFGKRMEIVGGLVLIGIGLYLALPSVI
jgi:putative Mn2+ efflux pump MntP